VRLNKDNVLKILHRNFGFKIVNNPVAGDVIKLSARDAYLYSSITGHPYLCNLTGGFSPNGLMQVFNQANSYNMVSGMFDRTGRFKYTPLLLSKEYPFITETEKFIIPLEYSKHSEYEAKRRLLFERLKKKGFNPSDFIICTIKKGTSGYGMEPFCEYVTSEYFRRRGYLTETQIPFYYNGGTPDFAAYDFPEVLDILRKKDLISAGATLIELATFRLFKSRESEPQTSKEAEAIVGEAKTSSREAIKQIRKYLGKKIFNRAYEIIPHKNKPEVICGLITFNEVGDIVIYEAKETPLVDKKVQTDYFEWLGNYIKYFLLANIDNSEFDRFYEKKTKREFPTGTEALIQFVNNLEYQEIIKEIFAHLKD
jgi:hypothetical protein